ncbi:arad-like aldolase/epimerase [Rhizodiscina lignyota]|uniref:Arad-like aldolase/epimerase n=1 Tax=Rhizodiscina lignyota TaxID=1504668 RepID=A0A9P4IGE5_9PEZI|nr:arad-like aldolase/epimerase [Rhizodiscina lignyota]
MDFKSTANQDVGFTNPSKPQFSNKYEEREWIKGRLAAAYRIFGHYGLNEGAAGHITVRDPIEPETFWVNPFGVDFNLINKSDLLRVDHHGNILNHGKVKVLNRAAFLIHGAIHAARPDVLCAAHTHSVYGRAFCALGRPLDPISLEACIFHDDHVVFEGKGVVLAEDEGCDIAVDLKDKKAALLRNHGLLTVGETIEEAVSWYYTLEKACQCQLLADAAATGRGGVTSKMSDEEATYTRGVAGTHRAGWFSGKMHFDLIDELTQKSYMQ